MARLDTATWFLFATFATAAAIATPFLFDHYLAIPQGATVFPVLQAGNQGRPTDFTRIATEGPLVLAVSGLTIYALHRLACLAVWTKIAAFAGVTGVTSFRATGEVQGASHKFLVCISKGMVHFR